MTAKRAIRRVTIRGRVQGVGFRAWTEHEARRRALEGWARNRRDGSVEAVFMGDAAAVGAAIEACRRGPLGARVDVLHEREGSDEDIKLRAAGDRFSVLPTV
jgi:acylphosphatase